MAEFEVDSGGAAIAGEQAGEGRPVVLLHGLTATRRYVVMGSKALERSGHRVVAYDARGHGRSAPAQSYSYDDLTADLAAVLDDLGVERAVFAGASMGAHTIAAFARRAPDRVAGAVFITPAHEPGVDRDESRMRRWDALAEGLRSGGIDGFLAADGGPQVPDQWLETVTKVIRQRLSHHENLDAVADALQQVPRSAPFDAWEELGAITAPAVVVASRDDADPGHPFATGERWAQALPNARLVTEQPGKSPIAWQGSQLSAVIAELAEQAR